MLIPLLSLASVFLSSAGVVSMPAPAPPHVLACPTDLGDRLRSALRPWLDEQTASGAFSGVVLVACDGSTVFSGAYGLANREKGIRNTMDTKFNVGSMGKSWTAIAIAQLVAQGKLDLDAPLGRYLPELPSQALREQVHVRHLLNHTSGLGTYFKRGFLRDRIAVERMTDYLRFFAEDSLSFTPGTRMEYSNAGYAILGMLIEQVTGLRYYDYMQTNVLNRAGMSGVLFVDTRAMPASAAVGYAQPPGAATAVDNTPMLEVRPGPAGGAHATAGDIIAFSRALWGGRLVDAATVKTFTTGSVDMGPGARYAFGFGTGVSNGVTWVGHNGGAPGVGTEFMSLPELGVDVVVLTNIELPAATNALLRAVAIVTGADPNRATRITRPPATSAASRPLPPGMPDTPVGRRTAGFIAAFSGGLDSLATFISTEMTPTADAPPDRAQGSQRMRDMLGKVTFSRVLRAEGNELEILLVSEKAGEVTLLTQAEPTAPNRLLPRPDFHPYRP